MSEAEVRLRFAPSPTGNFHLGSARTALYNWLFARKRSGVFVLRIEDTDPQRNTPQALGVLLDGLRWLGLDWDEGPGIGGPYGPYFQSQRKEIYGEYLRKLKDSGRTYQKDGAVYFRLEGERYREYDPYLKTEVEKVKAAPQVFEDAVRGRVTRAEERDFVLARSNGEPVFHLVNVVDDITMGITHVIRGDDHLSNTAKHCELFKALGLSPPQFAHLPMILNNKGPGKMSKRGDGVHVEDYVRRQFLSSGLVNFLALLGWNPKDGSEIMSRSELLEKFDLDGIQKGNARFDPKKLAHVNTEHLRRLSRGEFAERARSVLKGAGVNISDVAYTRSVLALCQEKVRSLDDLPAYVAYFFSDTYPVDEKTQERLLRRKDTPTKLKEVRECLRGVEDWTKAGLEDGFGQLSSSRHQKKPFSWFPITRFAVSGTGGGPDLLPMLEVLGRKRVLTRLEKGLEKPSETNFIRDIIDEELAAGKHATIVTRFPPEPNGYLHIGHSKAIFTNYSIACDYRGRFHLRFDDTNPSKEDMRYVEAIVEDLSWLGVDWGDNLFFASDYYEQLYQWAVYLIEHGKAYVDDLSPDAVKAYRGTLTEPGRNSPYRDRSIEENLDLFERMKNGEFADGSKVLRAKIDMSHPNLNMRDPTMYRILRHRHYRTADQWRIYPMYDFAHGQGDAIEGVTHSLCSLEFENHRPLYNWYIDNLPVPSRPRQIEFSRLNLTYTVMSKRKLLRLVEEGHVSGWDDPRMPTLSGYRRRGYTPEAIREFARRAGVTKQNQVVDIALLEFCLRRDLEAKALRRMAVLDPIKVILTNFPADTVEWYEGPNHPGVETFGARKAPLTREILIERADFMADPPRKYFRLAPGREVRLRYACYITAKDYKVDRNGKVVEILAEFDPASRGGSTPDGRKVKGTIHFVSATENVPLEVRLYQSLFNREDPDGKGDFIANLNPKSLKVIKAYGEPRLADAEVGDVYQFERKGYFCVDPDTTEDNLVFNQTVGLRDSWGKKRR